MSCMDKAGNVTDYGTTDTFTIDKTKPTLALTYDNNNAYSDNYYGEARIATLTVTEHNFDASDISVNVTASLDGAAESAPQVSGFSANGDVHTATITFNRDADYTISVSGVDLAGNESEDIPEQSFTVDLTAPEISFDGVDEQSSYTQDINPVVEITDTNYDSDGVTIEIVGGRNGVKNIDYSTANMEHGQTFTYDNLSRTQENDDCYVLTATAVDKAGHETVETIAYRVNRYGSTYELSAELQTAVDNYYAQASDKYAIYEYNVDELDNYSVSYTLDNDINNISENDGYKVEQSQNADNWYEYEYSIDKDIFSKEGV